MISLQALSLAVLPGDAQTTVTMSLGDESITFDSWGAVPTLTPVLASRVKIAKGTFPGGSPTSGVVFWVAVAMVESPTTPAAAQTLKFTSPGYGTLVATNIVTSLQAVIPVDIMTAVAAKVSAMSAELANKGV